LANGERTTRQGGGKLPDKLSEAIGEESERHSAKKRARTAAFLHIERCLKAIYDADLNRPIPAELIALLETPIQARGIDDLRVN
jgi:hypothetical protein